MLDQVFASFIFFVLSAEFGVHQLGSKPAGWNAYSSNT